MQSIYDTHYSSAQAAGEYVPQWMALRGKIDEARYQEVLALFNFQAGHAMVWRDAINRWFEHTSGIADAEGRVGHDANRLEAEDMRAIGYKQIDLTPRETASGGKAVICPLEQGCSLTVILKRPAGLYNIAVQYFDTWRGASRYELSINGKRVATWSGNDTLPPAQFDPNIDGQDSTRFTVRAVALKPGDTLTLFGRPDLRPELNSQQVVQADAGALNPEARDRRDYREYAAVDYIEFGPDSAVTPQ